MSEYRDKLVKGLLAGNTVNVTAISGRDLVASAKQPHGLSMVCTAALGRTLLQTAMMASLLKNSDERLTTMLKGGGEAGNIVCTGMSDFDGSVNVKGYVENPTVELPLAPNGKLDVALAVGWFGELTVIRDMSMKEPYVGKVQIVSGEIAEDFANYYTVSEQQPSLVYLGVRIDPKTSTVLSAGGLMLQPLPNCPDDVIDKLTELAKSIEHMSERLEKESLDSILASLFDGMDFVATDELTPKFLCDCSRERLEKVLISLGSEELTDMINTDKGAELTCRFCNTKYFFNEEELRDILRDAQSV